MWCKKGDNYCLANVSFSSDIHFQFLGFGLVKFVSQSLNLSLNLTCESERDLHPLKTHNVHAVTLKNLVCLSNIYHLII